MSICVYGRIDRKCMDGELLETLLASYFSCVQNAVRKRNTDKVTTYEGITNEDEIILSFVSEKNPPYNVYDSEIMDSEYKYMQLLIFDIKKEKSSIDVYKKIIDFCIYVRGKIEGDILVTSDVYNEICFLKEKNIIWSPNVSDKFNENQF